MTRAVGALCRGHAGDAMHLHAFAPLVLVGVLLLVCGAVLPGRVRDRLADAVELAETKGRLLTLLLALLFVYYLWRLVYRPDEIARILAV